MEYLDFELPIKDINDQIEKCKSIGNESSVDVTETCNLLGNGFNCLDTPLDHIL